MQMDLKVTLRGVVVYHMDDVIEICTSNWPGTLGPDGETVWVYQASGDYMIFWKEDIEEVNIRLTRT